VPGSAWRFTGCRSCGSPHSLLIQPSDAVVTRVMLTAHGWRRLYDKVVVAGHSLPALIRDDLTSLPPCHFATLRLVVGLLSAVAANAETNQVRPCLTPTLALTLAPTLALTRA